MLGESINKIENKDDFIKFIELLADDKSNNFLDWENVDIASYLNSIKSWVEDMEGYYRNMNLDIPNNIDWKFIATLFYVGKIYE
jgi:hypothetical protein